LLGGLLLLSASASAKVTEVFDLGKSVATGLCKLPGLDPIISFPKWGDAMLPDQPKMALAYIDSKEGMKEFKITRMQSFDASDKPNVAKDLVNVQSLFCPSYKTIPPKGQMRVNVMWALDAGKGPSDPTLGADAAKLMRIGVSLDGKTGFVERTWTFPKNLAPDGAYLNDVRVDEEGFAYITDSNSGTIIVYNLQWRGEHEGHPRGRVFDIEQMKPKLNQGESFKIGEKDLAAFQVGVDGIAYSKGDDMLYWKPVTRSSLYRTPAGLLREGEFHGFAYAEEGTEEVGTLGFHDGIDADMNGNVYLTDLSNGAIQKRDKKGQVSYIPRKEPCLGLIALSTPKGQCMY